MKTVRSQAIVLRRTNYGEADRILQLLTPDGRRSVMARGVRKQKSKLAGSIELFAVSDVVIGEGKGGLGILTSARLIQCYHMLLQDYDRLHFGYTAVKLVTRASETIDEPEWFRLLQEVFAGLDLATVPLDLVQAWFYIRYADLLGHELNLTLDVEGKPLAADLYYRYDNGERGFTVNANGSIAASHIKLLRLIASKPLQILVQIGGISELLGECQSVAREHAAIDVR